MSKKRTRTTRAWMRGKEERPDEAATTDAVINEINNVRRLVVTRISKHFKKKGVMPAALVAAYASLLDDARTIMLKHYDYNAVEVFIDLGERMATARREGREPTQGDLEVMKRAFSMECAPRGAEKLVGFKADG